MTLVPQFGMVEFLTLAIIALIVVGPKDLPKLLHGIGKVVGQLRRMADEFRASFDQMAREVEIDEMRKEIEDLKKANIEGDIQSALDEVDENLDVKKQPSGN